MDDFPPSFSRLDRGTLARPSASWRQTRHEKIRYPLARHIILGCKILIAASMLVEENTGVRPAIGGVITAAGTCNAL